MGLLHKVDMRMIGRRFSRKIVKKEGNPEAEARGFESFDLRLGDMMRGERATLGKSLLDVQRELRIKAAYVAAIENADPTAFDTPGFISGYVKSYARYLNMDPDAAFASFCNESGFSTAHGMSSEASSIRKPDYTGASASSFSNAFDSAPFVGQNSAAKSRKSDASAFGNRPRSGYSVGAMATNDLFAHIEPRAIGSMLVLLGLIGAIGFGGYRVLNEVQRVQLAPIENAPSVLADLDPLQNAGQGVNTDAVVIAGVSPNGVATSGVFNPPSDGLDRLYRPQALDVPVMIARDAPISTLNPNTLGSFAGRERDLPPTIAIADAGQAAERVAPRVVAENAPDVVLVAALPAWIRVRAADGSVIFEKVLEAGEEYILPATEEAPTLRAGMSGSIYFKVNGALYGPAGQGTSTIRDVALSVDALKAKYVVADLSNKPDVAEAISVADASRVIAPSE